MLDTNPVDEHVLSILNLTKLDIPANPNIKLSASQKIRPKTSNMVRFTAAASSSTTPDIDMTFISELYELIYRNPSSVEARRILMHQYLEANWLEAAANAAEELLKLDPQDHEALSLSLPFGEKAKERLVTANAQDSEKFKLLTVPVAVYKPIVPLKIEDVDVAMLELSQGYEVLRSRATQLQKELRHLQVLQLPEDTATLYEKHKHVIDGLVRGRIQRAFRTRQPSSARVTARAIEAGGDQALDIAISDLTNMAHWLRSGTSQSTTLDNDSIREAILKRVGVLVAALADKFRPYAPEALMHVEHEILHRTYVNDETMLGDTISEIPRSNFLVSEDGYAWDMEELAQAIKSADGVMRNPLSRQLFTTNDIRAIVQHPLGKGLAALQIEQSKLSKGVRSATVDRLDTLAKILMADMSADAMASRRAVDEFLAYVATLPDAEQEAIDKLRVPAVDKHTSQPFDTTIGEAVRDAQGNRTCFHKTGDFIDQAATHLRR